MMIIRYIFLVVLIIMSIYVEAQVGIGNPTPASTSVLDLTNPNNKGLVLPTISSTMQMSSEEGMLYFFNDYIYFRRSEGYNALSPWKYKFNGGISNHVYYNLGGNISIGSTDITNSPEAPLQVVTTQDVSLTDNGTLMLGASTGDNLAITTNEIQARNNGAAAALTINENGGDIALGTTTSRVDFKVSKKSRVVHLPTNDYFDIMPKGAIMIWSGTAADIPLGWGVCNGDKYATSVNKLDSITAPDLSGRFIVGAGSNAMNTYAAHDVGGTDSVTISMESMARHKHYSHDPGHRHQIKRTSYFNSGEGDNAHDKEYATGAKSNNSTTGNTNVTIHDDFTGGGKAHENTPAFYSLVYIIKL